MTQKIIALILVCMLTPITVAQAYQVPVEEPQFTRILSQDGVKKFQVAAVRYVPRGGGDRYVDMVGAVHIGDKAYYQDLNTLFRDYDAVLFEAVMPEGADLSAASQGEKSGLSSFQSAMAGFMGLTFQMDEVDYSGEHFYHADMTPTEFKQSMDNKGESIFSMVFNIMRADYANQLTGNAPISNFDMMKAMLSPNRQNAFREIMAKVLLDTEMLKVLEGSEGSTIIGERNNKALSVLTKAMKDSEKKSFAIFYGAGHLPDFHEKLVANFDMVPTTTQWFDAWTFE